MAYSYKISEEAEAEIFEGFLWYEGKSLGLGNRFLSALDRCFGVILQNPQTYKKYKSVRSYLMQDFPYIIYYFLKEQEIEIIGVIHTSRTPSILQERLE